MITVKPAAEGQASALFEALSLPWGPDCGALIAREGGADCGGAAFRLDGDGFTLLGVDRGEDPALCDLICRAAFNYAANRGVLRAELGEALPFETFVRLGYIKNAEERAVDLVKLFTKCKNCGKIH